MKVLSFSTSSEILSVCITNDLELSGEINVRVKRRHSVILLPVIDEIMKITETDIADIDMFVCDIGPGSFTGIRIGVSTANAFAQASEKLVFGVSGLEAAAGGEFSEGRLVSGIIYARNDQIYGAAYRDSKLIDGYFAGSIYQYVDKLSEISDDEMIFVGDGSVVFKEYIKEKFSGRAVFARETDNMTSAYKMVRIALKHGGSHDHIKPLYLKQSFAKELKK